MSTTITLKLRELLKCHPNGPFLSGYLPSPCARRSVRPFPHVSRHHLRINTLLSEWRVDARLSFHLNLFYPPNKLYSNYSTYTLTTLEQTKYFCKWTAMIWFYFFLLEIVLLIIRRLIPTYLFDAFWANLAK